MPDQKQQMTEEERKARNAEHQRKYRESQRNNPAYWERRHEYSKRFREKNAEKIAEKKRADYEKRKAEAPPRPPKEPKPPKPPKSPKPPKEPKPKAEPKPKKRTKETEPPPPPIQEVLPKEDAEWKSPAVCEVLACSKEYEGCRKYATIEQRKPADRPLRLKVVIFGSSVAELKREAKKIGITSFWNYGHIK